MEFLKSISDCDMRPFEKSPEGTKVVTRSVASAAEEKEKLEADISRMLREGVSPGQIVIMLNSAKGESSISELSSIGQHKVEAIGRTFRESSDAIRYTNIRLFKGLEADVVFILGSGVGKTGNDLLYAQGSRASTALYIYQRTGEV